MRYSAGASGAGGEGGRHKGFRAAGAEIYSKEGASALYKGFQPIVCRKVVWVTAFFVSYERLRDVFGNSGD